MSFVLKLFGGASIDTPTGALTGRAVQRRRLALLALLATAPRGMSRDKLIGYLWPETDATRARHLLSDSVYRINQAIGADAISAAGDELRLDTSLLPSDAAEFSGAVSRGEWERAVAAYTGPFMDGFFLSDSSAFDNWLDAERVRFERDHARALEALAGAAEDAGDRTRAVHWWRTLAAHDVYNSRIALRLMRALDEAGERAAAIQYARTFTLLLREEFGAEPEAEVVALAERMRSASSTNTGEIAARAAAESVTDAPAASSDATAGVPGGAHDEPVPAIAPDTPVALPGRPAAARDAGAAVPVPPAGVQTTPAGGPRLLAGAAVTHWRRRRTTLLATGVLAAAVLILGIAAIRQRDAAPVSPVASASSSALAVLPFADLSPEGDQEYFSDGITEELINRLAQVDGLSVVARTSAFAFKGTQVDIRDVGRRLNVGTVLEGSVRKSGSRIRITAQLIGVADGYHIWSNTYDRDMEDMFAVQDEIARAIVQALTGTLAVAKVGSAAEPAVEPAAYDLFLKGRHSLYLKGRYNWYRRTEEGIRTALSYFEQAVTIAPDFARAHAGLADAYAVLGFYDYLAPDEAFPKAEAAARRAQELDPALAAPHSTLGYVALYYHWDWPRAEQEFLRSIELDASYSTAHQWYANFLTAMARFDEAEREMRLAQEIDPLSLIANAALGWVYYFAGDNERAIEQCRQTLELDANYAVAMLWSGWALEELGRVDEAIEQYTLAVSSTSGSTIYVAALARAHALAGNRASAAELLRGIEARDRTGGYVPSYEVAKVYEALGQRDRAMEWLERAHGERSHSMVFLQVDPQLRALRDDPRFRDLVARVGLE